VPSAGTLTPKVTLVFGAGADGTRARVALVTRVYFGIRVQRNPTVVGCLTRNLKRAVVLGFRTDGGGAHSGIRDIAPKHFGRKKETPCKFLQSSKENR
jgi:hypothetical protein